MASPKLTYHEHGRGSSSLDMRDMRGSRTSRDRHGRLGLGWRGPRQLGEGRIKHFEHEIGIGLRNGHRWREPDHAAMQAALAEKQTHFATKLQYLSAFCFGRLFRRSILHQFDSEHKAFATDVADEFVFGFELFQTGQNMVA